MQLHHTLTGHGPDLAKRGEWGEGFTPNRWTLTLTNAAGRVESFDYWAGPAVKHTDAGDVLACLLIEAGMIYEGQTFEDFAAELGLDTDSRKAEAGYRDLLAQRERLAAVLGFTPERLSELVQEREDADPDDPDEADEDPDALQLAARLLR